MTDGERIVRHVSVRGRVQGVGFRAFVEHHALQRGIEGWVRNRRDGTVEAEVEGTPDQVDEMLAWMAEGPPGSRVESATVRDVEPAPGRGFGVLPTA